MLVKPMLHFGPFTLDLLNERLWRGTELVSLRPKPFLLLRYLVEQAGRVVAKRELLKAVWPDTMVSAGVLKAYIHDLRAVLGDEPRVPQFIETVGRRGYRFIAPLTTAIPPVRGAEYQGQSAQSPIHISHSAVEMVGREVEVAQLQSWLAQAVGGERQVVFVTGEAGIGKTTLVEAFMAQAAIPRSCWLGHGQCIEHFGTGEAYLPVLAALGQLCRAPGQERWRALLEQHAPTWLMQMPALLSAVEQEALQRRTLGATRERMLRELAEALEVLTAEQPLVLVLEDLHWSDYATLDLLAFVARRHEPARLLVIGTYRPAEVILREHPLKSVKQELQLHGQCQELALEFLPEGAVAAYLAARFPGREVQASLVRTLYERTDGNPLFLVTMVEELLRQGMLVPSEKELVPNDALAGTLMVPATLHQMLEQQVERLSPAEQQMLEAASVAGAEFSPAAVAAGLAAPVEEVEQQCAALARRGQFLRSAGTVEWPDGTVATRYGFLHALYQDVLSAHVTAALRMSLHRRIGEREEHAYGARASEIAAELAVHFEHGREYRRAVHYLEEAGKNAMRRSAHHEASTLLAKGLELLKTLPDTPERNQQELVLQTLLGDSLMVAKGWAAPEVERVYRRALALCRHLGETPQLYFALEGLFGFSLVRAELQTARELADQCLTVARSTQDAETLLWAHHAQGETLFYLGEFPSARRHFEQGIALYDPQKYNPSAILAQEDPGVVHLTWAAWTLWFLGYPDQAQRRIHAALTLAEEFSHPFSLAYALYMAAQLHQFRQEQQLTQERAEALTALCTTQGFPTRLAQGVILRGWAVALQGQGTAGIPQIWQGLATWQATGAEIGQPQYFTLLAEAYAKAGQTEEALTLLTEALATAHITGERYYEAELYRLKGELTLQAESQSLTSPPREAEACFQKAIAVARSQSAKSLELRATVSLARLWQRQGKNEEARKLLADIYGWFTEGFDTKDLQEAKALFRANACKSVES